jgi:hypothetical protein
MTKQERTNQLHEDAFRKVRALRDELNNWLKHYEPHKSIPYYFGSGLVQQAVAISCNEARVQELNEPLD